MAKYEWLYGNWFPCPPRGPCLERIHWYRNGLGLCAIDYMSEIEDEPGHQEYEFHVDTIPYAQSPVRSVRRRASSLTPILFRPLALPLESAVIPCP